MPMPVLTIGKRWLRNPFLSVPAFGLLIRGILVLGTHRRLVGAHDQLVYFIAAGHIATGRGYLQPEGMPTAYYPPGYPYFLGGLQTVAQFFGLRDSLELVGGLAQCVLAALMIAAVMRSTWLLTGKANRRVVVLSGLIVACWPNLVAYSAVLLSEQLFLTLVCGTFAATLSFLVEVDERKRTWWLIASALSLGCAVAVRPQILLWIPVVGLIMLAARRPFRQTVTLLGALGVGVVVVLTPWTIRNASLFDSFVPLSNNSGDNLCLGFNKDARGHFFFAPECESVPFYRTGPEAELIRNEVNTRRALSWIRHNVGELPELTFWKFRWAYEHDYDGLRALEDYESDPWIPSGIRKVLRPTFTSYLIGVGLLALMGLGIAIRQLRVRHGPYRLPIALLLGMTFTNAIVPALFFGDARFKVPALPFYAILAAFAVDLLWKRWRPV